MGHYFLESSALVKRYKQEPGTNIIDRLFDESDAEWFYLNLAEIEIRKVFYRLWKYPQAGEQSAQISEADFLALQAAFTHDLGQMRRIELTDSMIEHAVTVLEKVWLKSVFDLAHLAAYLVMKEEYEDLIFVCSDQLSNLVDGARAFVAESSIVIPQ